MIRRFFDDNGKVINDGIPACLGVAVAGGTPIFHRQQEAKGTSVFEDKDSSISKMMKDKKMVRMIREGKGSDKGIKAESYAIEKENSRRPKEKWLKQKKDNIKRMKREFKIKD